jgi:putative iron-dependent peroxidase
MTAQPGIFALGTTDHCHLEFDLVPGRDERDLVLAVARVTADCPGTDGVNVVVGFRATVWEEVAPETSPVDAADWTQDLIGADGYRMPATQHDAWVWIAGGDRGAVFDRARSTVRELASVARAVQVHEGWVYHRNRDLTGFVDGTENPGPMRAPEVACVPGAGPAAGSSVVLVQRWARDAESWDALSVREQELAMGRTKADDVELGEDEMPASAHVSRTSLTVDGRNQEIFRRNVAYGGVDDFGTIFVGFSAEQHRLFEMVRRMAGAVDGIRDALTFHLTPRTGAYYVVPSVTMLSEFVDTDD